MKKTYKMSSVKRCGYTLYKAIGCCNIHQDLLDLFQTENTVQTRMGVEINKIAYSHDDKDDNCRKLKKSKANVQHGGDGNMNQQ